MFDRLTGSKPELPTTPLTTEELFDILSNQRRRLVIQHVANNGEQDRRSLTQAIAAAENATEIYKLTSRDRQTVWVALYQTHLDALDEAGVIEWIHDSEDDHVICPTPLTEAVASIIAAVNEATDPDAAADPDTEVVA